MERKYARALSGFTIIELLVVIGIIGILITIMAVSFIYVRNNARDGRVAGEMDQLRKSAFAEANNHAGLYDGIDCTLGSLQPLCSSVEDLTGNNLQIINSPASWCAEIELRSGSPYCVDVAGTAIQGYECSANVPYVCTIP